MGESGKLMRDHVRFLELCLQFYARVVFGYLRLYSHIWCDMGGSQQAPSFLVWRLAVANYPVFHVKHWTFVEWSGDDLPDPGWERWRFSGVKWSGADPGVVVLYCAEALWDAEGGVTYCGVSLYQYMSLIVMSDYFFECMFDRVLYHFNTLPR